MYQDYESFEYASKFGVAVLEAYSGTSIVGWYGDIERQLNRLEDEQKSSKNAVYADRIHTFLNTWKDHEIDGSLNREPLEALIAASQQLASDPWKLNVYFSTLRDQLKKVLASVEELPLDSYVEPRAVRPSGGGGRKKPAGPPSDNGPVITPDGAPGGPAPKGGADAIGPDVAGTPLPSPV